LVEGDPHEPITVGFLGVHKKEPLALKNIRDGRQLVLSWHLRVHGHLAASDGYVIVGRGVD
jgi:hypothetical protein